MADTLNSLVSEQTDLFHKLNYNDEVILKIRKAINNREKILIYAKDDREGICSISMLILLFRYFNADFDYFLVPSCGSKDSLISDAKTHISLFNPSLMISLDDKFTSSVYDYIKDINKEFITIGHETKSKKDKYYNPQYSTIFNVFEFAKELSTYYDTKNIYRYVDLVYLGSKEVEINDKMSEIFNMGISRLDKTKNYGINAFKKFEYGDDKSIKEFITPKNNPASMVDNSRIIIELLTTDDENRALQIAKYLINSNYWFNLKIALS